MAQLTPDEQLLKLGLTLKDAENPFDSNKVQKAREDIVDVQDIHRDSYDRLNRELERVRKGRKSRGVLVSGVAGSGKSHLIARLYRERPKNVLFFQVEALPGGTGWLKHILQCMVNDLEQPIGPDDSSPQLIVLIQHFIAGVKARKKAEKEAEGQSLPSFEDLNEALDKRLKQIESTIADPIASDLLRVMANLYCWQAPWFLRKKAAEAEEKTALASRWLKGTMIEEDELKIIGVKANLGSDETVGQANFLTALRVFGMLTEGRAPIVLAFDQLDTMQPDSVHSLGTQLLDLIGRESAAPNYLVVTAGVGEEMDEFINNRIITQAVADVIFKTRIELPAMGMDQCTRIVARRLELVLLPEERELAPPIADDLFPFTTAFLERELDHPVKPSPRKVLTVCCGLFEQIVEEVNTEWLQKWPDVPPLARNVPPPQRPTSDMIRGYLGRELDVILDRLSKTATTAAMDDENLANTIRRLIESCGEHAPLRVVEPPKGRYKKPSDAFFSVTENSPEARRVGIAVNNKGHPNALKAALAKAKMFFDACGTECSLLFLRDENAKSLTTWNVCNGIIEHLEKTQRFTFLLLESDHVAILRGLDELRRAVPDLIIPPSAQNSAQQVTPADFGEFLIHCSLFWDLPLFAEARKLLRPPWPSVEPKALVFVLARIEAKKIYDFETLVQQWATHDGRSKPETADRELIEAAVSLLMNQGKAVVISTESSRVVKKI